MSTDVTVESSTTQQPTEAADIFYKSSAPSSAESTPATENNSAPAAEKQASETASVSETETPNSEESESSEPKPQRSNAERRIQQLLREKKELEQRLQQPRTEQRQPATQADTPKGSTGKADDKSTEQAPDPSDPKFQTYADYLKAEREFRQKEIERHVQEAIARDRAEQQRISTERQQQEAFARKQQELFESVKATEKRHPDFREKVFDEDGNLRSDVQLNPVVDQFIPHSKVGMEMLYHFATNPDDAARFLKLDGYDALREAIALEARLTEGLQTPPVQKPKLKPPSTVSGKNGAAPKVRSAEEVFYGADD
jgi:hypothetical protein